MLKSGMYNTVINSICFSKLGSLTASFQSVSALAAASTLGNMRKLVVQRLIASCVNDDARHRLRERWIRREKLEATMKTETERMSDHAIKRMVEQLYDDLIAVGNMVRHTYGEGASKQATL